MLICKTGCGLSVGKTPGISLTRFPQLCRNGLDIGALARIFEKEHGEDAGDPVRDRSCDREIFVDRRIRLEDRDQVFPGARVAAAGEAPSWMIKEPRIDPAVAGRQKGKGQRLKKNQTPDRAGQDDRHREPAAVEKPVERTAVELEESGSKKRLMNRSVQVL